MGNNIVGIKDFSFQNVGSEWRKWDLHVHTPFSYLNNQFGNDFDNYVKKLFKKAIEKEIAVIGITDYFCIESTVIDFTKIEKMCVNKYYRVNKLTDNVYLGLNSYPYFFYKSIKMSCNNHLFFLFFWS